ncbi:MAG: SgcJ/EcaC family oxidoreductase [Planctomycetes bacterium]|nr:SgcJ/EcaC family oxidoreductase [Planctomycetota bacterium]
MATLAVMALATIANAADKAVDTKAAEAAIRASGETFVKAFNKGDAKSLAELWTEEGTLADQRGVILKGRKAIQGEYAALFKQQPGAKIEVAIQSIDFPTPTMAVEDGIGTVITKQGAAPTASRYTAVHVKQDNTWLMASVRESSIDLPSNYQQLQSLEWLVGKWESKGGGASVHTTIQWFANKSFLKRDYTVKQDGVTVSSGMQIIGLDPQAGQVRSWSFDAAGGFGTGLWTATPQGWQIESAGVLADGTPTSSQELLIRVADENNVLGWRSINRKVGDVKLPDTREVVLDRVPEKR